MEELRQKKRGEGSVWSGRRCVWNSGLNHLQCFPFTWAVPSCVPLLFPPTRTDLKQQLRYMVTMLAKVEPLILILEFLSCRGTGDNPMFPIPAVSFPIPDKYFFSFSSRSQFWLGVNNERKQEGRSERGMNERWMEWKQASSAGWDSWEETENS